MQNLVLTAQNQVIQIFKAHKILVEKAVAQQLNKLTLLKRQHK